MSPTNQPEFSQLVRTFLKADQSRTFSDTDDLMRLGILDSLRIIELISFLEEHFAIRIEPKHITSENFSTIEGMRTLIDRLTDVYSH